MVICLLNAIIFIINIKTILRLPRPKAINIYLLQQSFRKTTFSNANNNRRIGSSIPKLPLYLGRRLRHFWGKVLRNLMHLLVMSGSRWGKTTSTNKKKSKTGLHNLNISNQFYWILTLIVLHQKASFVVHFIIVSSLQ